MLHYDKDLSIFDTDVALRPFLSEIFHILYFHNSGLKCNKCTLIHVDVDIAMNIEEGKRYILLKDGNVRNGVSLNEARGCCNSI